MVDFDKNDQDEFEDVEWQPEDADDQADEYAEGEYAEDEYAEGEYAEGEYAEDEYAEGDGEYAEEYGSPDDILPDDTDVSEGDGESWDDGDLPPVEGLEEEDEEPKIGTSIYEVMVWIALGATLLGVTLMLLEMFAYDMIVWPSYK